ncbi:MAG: alpha/beta hydrolase [Rudaea sp.]
MNGSATDLAMPAHDSLVVASAVPGKAHQIGVDTNGEGNDGQIVKLWPGIAPGSEHWKQKEIVVADTPVGTVAVDVVVPTLALYLASPDRARGAGIVVAPGGYCVALALSAEGADVARWLQHHGISAFVLKYRTKEKLQQGIPKNPDMDAACHYGIADAIQSIKLVRQHAAEWHVDPKRVGIIGFSAGGMVASGALLQKDVAARPDFAAFVYGAPFGVMPHIPAALPPIFMAWAQDDELAGAAVSRFHDALVAAGHKPEAHIFSAGGHGFGLRKQGTTSDYWNDEFYHWLSVQGFLTGEAH